MIVEGFKTNLQVISAIQAAYENPWHPLQCHMDFGGMLTHCGHRCKYIICCTLLHGGYCRQSDLFISYMQNLNLWDQSSSSSSSSFLVYYADDGDYKNCIQRMFSRSENTKTWPWTAVSSHPPYKLDSQFRHSTFGALASVKDPKIWPIVFSLILRSEGLECCHKSMHIATRPDTHLLAAANNSKNTISNHQSKVRYSIFVFLRYYAD